MSKILTIIKFHLLCLLIFSLISPSLSIKDLYSYKYNDTIKLSVGSMNSIETQLPFDYYYLGICKPTEVIQEPDNLGEILTGDKSYQTNYIAQIGNDEYCKELCAKNFTDYDVNLFKWFLSRNYTTTWYLDKLPAGLKHITDKEKLTSEVHYLGGIPLGYVENKMDDSGDFKIYNHYTLTIQIHNESGNLYTIVGFNIMPFSIDQNTSTGPKCGNKEDYNKNFRAERQSLTTGENILFTYDVVFEKSNVAFSSRWDHYLHLQNDKIHWFSLINGSLFVLIPSFIILHIFCRSLKRDIDIYNTRVSGEDFIDEFGWKQVCNDVFRKPAYTMLLSSLIGSGIQLTTMIFYTLIFAVIGFLTPEKRGALLMIMIFLFVFMGVFAGYFASRFYKMFGGKEWLKMSMLTAFLYPSIIFTIFIIINFMLWMEKSSAGVKFSDLLALLLLWICCSSPLVLIGSFMGVKKKTIKNPCKVNPLPSQIPEKSWYLKLRYSVLFAGLITFLAVSIELVYIMASIWRHYFYYLFGFLLVVLIILIVLCSEISIIYTYVNLCRGDYNWWWKSFIISASPALYVFVYSIYYFFTLNIRRVSSIVLYFGLMSIVSSMVFLVCGTIGFIMTYLFTRKIYSMIKID